MHVDSWAVVGKLKSPKPFLVCSYGHKTKESARLAAEQIKLICDEVKITHTWRKTMRSKWEREEYVF